MTKIESLQKEINSLRNKLNTKISNDEKQKILDLIDEKKREIEKISRSEKLAVPINGPKLGERTRVNKSIFSNNRVIL